jgi:hypothetical protein
LVAGIVPLAVRVRRLQVVGFLADHVSYKEVTDESFPSRLKVAGIGCGTGTWIRELRKWFLFTCSLTGFDISSIQFPDESSRPKNMRFEIPLMMGPIPGRGRKIRSCGCEVDKWLLFFA